MSAAAVAALLISIPWRWLPSFEAALVPLQAPARVVQPQPVQAPPPAKLVQLADEVVIRAIDHNRAAFRGCWKRALAADPLLDATKVTVHAEVSANGVVVNVTTDAANDKLGNCLTNITRSMKFAAPDSFASADFPLFFEPE